MRIKAAKEIAKRNVAGFVLGSFGLGESQEMRTAMIEAILKELPSTKPRILPGVGSPEEILHCVNLGIDLFNSNYPNLLTEWGYAMTFSLNPSISSDVDSRRSKINLRDKRFQLDQTALAKECSCFTCRNHTKAYLHHLLNTHEMLANVLLIIHNCFHYLEFFRNIRWHIKNGTFSTYSRDLLQLLSSD